MIICKHVISLSVGHMNSQSIANQQLLMGLESDIFEMRIGFIIKISWYSLCNISIIFPIRKSLQLVKVPNWLLKITLFEGGFWICYRPRPFLDNFDIYLPLSRTTAWERKFCCISHQNILKSMLFHRQKIFMSKSVKILHCISGIALSAILKGRGPITLVGFPFCHSL